MLKNKIALAAVAMSALALYATQASAQATPFYNSPAQARTDDGAVRWGQPVTSSNRRIVVRPRGVDAFAAVPGGRVPWPTRVDNVHPSVADY
jgi:hypothetical protein